MRDGWKSLPLAKLCTVFTDGDWIETKNQSPEGIRLIQTGNVGVGEYKDRRNKARFISEETCKKLKCEKIYEGDCLVSRLPDPVGRSCIIPDTGDKMITAVDCTIIRFDTSCILPEFFNYYSQSAFYLQDVDIHCTGATRKRISRKNLGRISIPVAPLAEQKRIVAILDEAFAGIETAISNTEKNLANARELFDSYLRSIFTARDPHWMTSIYQDCINTIKPPTKTPKKSFGDSGDFPIISQEKGLINGWWSKSEDVIQVEIPVLVFGDHTRIFKYVDFDFVAGADGTKVLKPKSFIDAKYLYYYSLSLSLKALGYSRHYRVLKDLNVWYPEDLSEQRLLADKAESMNDDIKRLIRNYVSKLASLEELKQSLLQKAFAGELTAGAEKEVEEAAA